MADIVLLPGHLKRQDAAGVELLRRLEEKLLRVKTVQLCGKRIRQVDEDDVEVGFAGFEEQPPIHGVDADRVGRCARDPRCREVALGDAQYRRVQFDIVDALQAGVLQGLGQAAVDAPANQQHRARRGCSRRRSVRLPPLPKGQAPSNPQPVLEKAPAFTRRHQRQIAVNEFRDSTRLKPCQSSPSDWPRAGERRAG